jgi:hypothetical protein
MTLTPHEFIRRFLLHVRIRPAAAALLLKRAPRSV